MELESWLVDAESWLEDFVIAGLTTMGFRQTWIVEVATTGSKLLLVSLLVELE